MVAEACEDHPQPAASAAHPAQQRRRRRGLLAPCTHSLQQPGQQADGCLCSVAAALAWSPWRAQGRGRAAWAMMRPFPSREFPHVQPAVPQRNAGSSHAMRAQCPSEESQRAPARVSAGAAAEEAGGRVEQLAPHG
jgi:hypothetical protein